MGYATGTKLNRNIEAVRLAFAHGKIEPTYYEAVLDALKAYSGFGGLRPVVFGDGSREDWVSQGATETDLKLYDGFSHLYALLKRSVDETQYRAIVDSMKHSALSGFYTPAFFPARIYQTLSDMGIAPKRLYDPSAGSGIFITEALAQFPSLEHVTAVEKDLITGIVLKDIFRGMQIPGDVHISGFENTSSTENSKSDIIISNIPFGNFSVYDPLFDKGLTGRIHNYFFVKGLDKLADGGIMAFLTTDRFLNSPNNARAREYVFKRADFISLLVCPDNLMKDSANTEAPTHLLLLQKNAAKSSLSQDELLLSDTTTAENEFGKYDINRYLMGHTECYLGERRAGHNQYGEPHLQVWQDGDISGIVPALGDQLTYDIGRRFNLHKFSQISAVKANIARKSFTLKEMPERRETAANVQLGLFDAAPPEIQVRAQDYLNDIDRSVVLPNTAKILGITRTTEVPDHELLVMVTAKHRRSRHYLYRVYANTEGLTYSERWMNHPDFAEQLRKIGAQLQKYNNDYYIDGDTTLHEPLRIDKGQRKPLIDVEPFHKEGALLEIDGVVGHVERIDDEKLKSVFAPAGIAEKNTSFYLDYLGLRSSYFALNEKEFGGENTAGARKDLQESYEGFVTKYGQLNSKGNRKLIDEDRAYGLAMQSSLERREGKGYVPSDIIYSPVFERVAPSAVSSVDEALAISLNDRGELDLDYIAAMVGKPEDAIIAELGAKIYNNPATGLWETADKYLSGNVVAKLAEARDAIEVEPDNVQFRRSMEAIQGVQPERITFGELDFNFGERWIPTTIYEDFCKELFGCDVSIQYLRSSDNFTVYIRKDNDAIRKEYAIFPKSGMNMYGSTLLEHALENTSPIFTYEKTVGGNKVRVTDNDATQLANDKIERIRNRFIDWVKQQPEATREFLEKRYNATYNCHVLRKFDGTHQTFPGLDLKAAGIPALYDSQRDATWRLVQDKGGVIDHEVGLGKTLIMILAAQEMKRLGLVRKSLIIALDANIDEIASTYKLAYPNARVLAPGKVDFEKKNRQRLFHEIKNNNWDCVILTHDQFTRIPQSLKVQEMIFEQELDNVNQDLEVTLASGSKKSKQVIRGLEIKRNNLKNKLKDVQHSLEQRRDNDVTFEDMGIDHLFVDEAHHFKNLTFSTRHTRVAGLGNTDGAMKALNMLFSIRTLQERFNADRCATFLSGTPISNSLCELYLLFKYMCPRELERTQIESFDAWAAVYARKTVDFEFSITNQIVSKERFRHFIKVPELALMYNEITDYKTGKHINLDRPTVEEILVNLAPTPDQEIFAKKLIEFAKIGDGRLIGRSSPLSKNEDRSRMLLATNLAKKMAVDMRLIDPVRYADHPNNKVNTCARKVKELYEQSSEQLGTQLIFCDQGTPNTDGFNLYNAMREALVAKGIPRHQITFIHHWKRQQRKELYQKMNAGEIRVLIGSTSKAGTGLNVQQRVVGMHHLDIPWRPIDFNQRNGRGARPGNLLIKLFNNNKVKTFIYATEKSLDGYKFNLLKLKQYFITQLKLCKLHTRTIDEGAMDEETGMNYAEYVAVLSGDTSLLDKSKLERVVTHLESLRAAHFREQKNYSREMDALSVQLPKSMRIWEELVADEELYNKQLLRQPDGTKLNPIVLDGLNNQDPEAVGKYLYQLFNSYLKQNLTENVKLGSLYGYDLFIGPRGRDKMLMGRAPNEGILMFAQRHGSQIKYTYGGGLSPDNTKGNARMFLNAIDRVRHVREDKEKEVADMKASLESLSQLVGKPFEHEDGLKEAKRDLESLNRKIFISLQSDGDRQKGVTDNDAVDATYDVLDGLLNGRREDRAKYSAVGMEM